MTDSDVGEGVFEFVIGVTGHRDAIPAHVPAIKTIVRDALSGLVRRFKFTPIRIVTGLAEGADTIVTEVALEMGLEVTALKQVKVC